MTKKNKEEYVVVLAKTFPKLKDAKVLDNPVDDAPVVCEIAPGKRLQIISKPNKKFYGVGISNSVVGFIRRDDVKTE